MLLSSHFEVQWVYTKKNLFLSFDGGYHGDTFGAMSVGAKSGSKKEIKIINYNISNTIKYSSKKASPILSARGSVP